MSTPEPGWYSAPDRVGHLRYWDGVQWTDQYQAAAPSPTSPPMSTPGPRQEGEWWPAPAMEAGVGRAPNPVGEYASFGARAGAAVVDSLIVLAATFALGASLGVLFFLIYGDVDDQVYFVFSDVVGFLIDYVLVLALYWWYYTTGWSPGRALVGIRIVDEQGGRPGARRGIGRLLMSFVSTLILGVGYLAMLWSPTKQTWHDGAAGTYVVRVR